MSDSCGSIEMHVDKISARLTSFASSCDASIDNVVEHIETLKRELLVGPDVDPHGELSVMAVMMWEKAVAQLKKLSNQVIVDHRDMHGGISKCGREIDKTFVASFSGVYHKPIDFENDPTLKCFVNDLILQHLLTSGMFEIAERFAGECHAKLDDETKRLYLEIDIVLNGLRNRDLEPALEWCTTHAEELRKIGSVLEFTLHKMKFVEKMRRGAVDQLDTLAYAKVFQSFSEKHLNDVKALMGAMLFIPHGLGQSPYRSLQEPQLWHQVYDLFSKDACRLLGLPLRSPLSIILNAGAIALPALLNIRQIMQQRQVMGMFSHSDELPIEIDIGDDNRFHSIFSCPILRQQTTDKNPPMRLSCGHAISKEALQKLASNNKLKCPYCPQESSVADAKQLFF